MSRPNEKPAWASKIIHQLNTNARDLIAMQRSLVRIEATVMTLNQTTEALLARTPNVHGNQVLVNNRQTNNGTSTVGTYPPRQNQNRSIQNLVNRPAPNRPHYSNVHYNRGPNNPTRAVVPEQLAAPHRPVAQINPNNIATKSYTPATQPPVA